MNWIILLAFISCTQMDKFTERELVKEKKNEPQKRIEQKNISPQEVIDLEKVDPIIFPVSPPVQVFFNNLNQYFDKYQWPRLNPSKNQWKHVRNSPLGTPLIWTVFGNEAEHKLQHKNMTLILCGVHGDEITPARFCFDIINFLNSNPKVYGDHNLVVVAPLVTPDSFLKDKPTRTNSRGVDINRNFPTKDWHEKALSAWKGRFKSDKRRFPGKKPLSEPETLFQVNLIKRYKPDKIISVHAPLTMLDYDGPSFEGKTSTPQSVSAMQLLIQMSQKASGYNVSNYPYFPGSLGNYAGNERSIPTYTVELPSTDYTKSDKYWSMFQEAIEYAVGHDLRNLPISKNVNAGAE